MAKLTGIVQLLKDERDRVQKQLSALNAALTAFVGTYGDGPSVAAQGKRTVSATVRRRISQAQKARWKKAALNGENAGKKPRTMSAAARRKIAAAQRARWAKLKANKKTA